MCPRLWFYSPRQLSLFHLLRDSLAAKKGYTDEVFRWEHIGQAFLNEKNEPFKSTSRIEVKQIIGKVIRNQEIKPKSNSIVLPLIPLATIMEVLLHATNPPPKFRSHYFPSGRRYHHPTCVWAVAPKHWIILSHAPASFHGEGLIHLWNAFDTNTPMEFWLTKFWQKELSDNHSALGSFELLFTCNWIHL